jgi:hypothetical protein
VRAARAPSRRFAVRKVNDILTQRALLCERPFFLQSRRPCHAMSASPMPCGLTSASCPCSPKIKKRRSGPLRHSTRLRRSGPYQLVPKPVVAGANRLAAERPVRTLIKHWLPLGSGVPCGASNPGASEVDGDASDLKNAAGERNPSVTVGYNSRNRLKKVLHVAFVNGSKGALHLGDLARMAAPLRWSYRRGS